MLGDTQLVPVGNKMLDGQWAKANRDRYPQSGRMLLEACSQSVRLMRYAADTAYWACVRALYICDPTAGLRSTLAAVFLFIAGFLNLFSFSFARFDFSSLSVSYV